MPVAVRAHPTVSREMPDSGAYRKPGHAQQTKHTTAGPASCHKFPCNAAILLQPWICCLSWGSIQIQSLIHWQLMEV